MPREIKTTIAVDGEAAFKRAINDASTSIRNMGTQLTLAQAQFKKDGDAMKLMETRSKALKGEIGQQEEIVKALEKAVSDSAKAYGENSQKTEKWEAELNRAKAKLVSLQSELTLNEAGLDRNGKAFDESSQKAADYQATLKNIGKNVSFQSITQGIGGITSTVENAVKKVIGLARTIREAFTDAGQWADELSTNAIKYDMDVETLQKWQNAADFIDTDVETIISARDKLGKKMKNGWKDDGLDMWEVLGVDLTDAEGKYRDKMDVMWEVGETLMSMAKIDGDDVRADAYAMEVFGKSWRELLPLFTAGREEWEKTVDSQRVVSAERVKALTELDDANQALENSWDVTKYSFLAELAPTITDVTNAVTEMLKAFNEWMDTDEGKQAMEDLSKAIQELFSGLKDVSFKDAIDKVKSAIDGIKDALSWLGEHKQEVYDALKIIAAGFGLLKVGELAVNIGKIVNGLKSLWNWGGKDGTDTKQPTEQPTEQPKANPTKQPTKQPPAQPTVPVAEPAAPLLDTLTTTLTGAGLTGAEAATAASSLYASVPGLSGLAGAGGIGGAVGGLGSLSLAGVAGGTGLIALGMLALGAYANNAHHQWWGEVGNDADRYSFMGVNDQRIIQQTVQGMQGDSPLSRKWQMRWMAQNMGERIWQAFDYTDAETGEERNRLKVWLGSDNAKSAEAFNIIAQAYGLKKDRLGNYDITSSPELQALANSDHELNGLLTAGATAYAGYQQVGNKVDYSNVWTDMIDFFKRGMVQDENGKWIIPGYDGSSYSMPVINGIPLANMSGYVMSNTGTQGTGGTWDPAGQLMQDALSEMKVNTESTKQAAEVAAGMDLKKFNGLPAEMRNAVQVGVSRGINGIRVTIDGRSAGSVLAPYVNEFLGALAQ